MSSINFGLIEFYLYWGMGLIGVVATIYSIFFSEDKILRRSALFSLFCFLLATIFMYEIRKKYLANYGFSAFLNKDWISFSGWNILLYLLFADLIFYFYHRLNHIWPLLWIGHFSHHAAERMHLSLTVRDNILIHIFVLPVGLLGIPIGFHPAGIFVGIKFIILYQSFLHFETKKDIPILKYFLITPYNHIIHHSIHFEGAGQNFGGIFCFWDRIFGTYREGEKYLEGFGLSEIKNPDSLWTLNVEPLVEIAKECWRKKSIFPIFVFSHLKYSPSWKTILLYTFFGVLAVNVVGRMISFF